MSEVTFRPIGSRVLAKIDAETDTPTKTKSGLILPPSARNVTRTKLVTAVIIKVGNGKRHPKKGHRIPMDPSIQEGVRVLTDRYWGDIVELEGEEYRILGEHQIHGIVDNWDGMAVSDFQDMPGARSHTEVERHV